MSQQPQHHVVTASAYQVPKPFSSFAVRSDERSHAWSARSPYGRVHLVRTHFLHASALASLAAEGFAHVRLEGFSDIAHANTSLEALACTAPGASDLLGGIASALQLTGVLGHELAAYLCSVATRIDYLACCGAGFHNDVNRQWSRCRFWLLALDTDDVEFVMPHAAVRIAVAPGDLLVFDQTMAHGLCRPADGGQAVAASFEGSQRSEQIFLTGELLLSDAQWAAIGAPWLPVDALPHRGALDLMVAEFDERTGAIKCPRLLRHGMKRSTCHVDEPMA